MITFNAINKVYITAFTGLLIGTLTAPIIASVEISPVSTEEFAWIVETTPRAVDSVAVAADKLSDDKIKKLKKAFSGVAVNLTLDEVELLESRPDVIAVHPDLEMSLFDTQANAPWHLSRLDQVAAPADTAFTYPASAGSNVRVYIVDTGISPNEAQLGTRLLPGISVVTGETSTTDCQGHGSHVAGLVASTSYGVAKRASVVPVRVFACTGSSTTSTVIAGLDWVLANHPVGTPGIVNMSLGSDANTALDSAVQKLITAGFVVVAAAGNGGSDSIGDDACLTSPARVPGALTVGATTSTDARPSWSNFGPCLDLFAPGSMLQSLRHTDPAGSVLMSGTSMAAPVVAGVAALTWGSSPSASASQISADIVRASTVGIVSNSGVGSPANLTKLPLFTSGIPEVVTSLRVTENTGSRLTLAWSPPTPNGTSPVTDYVIQSSSTASPTWTTLDDGINTSTSYTILNPTASTTFTFRVMASNVSGNSAPATVSVTTPSGVPGVVTSLRVTENISSRLTLAWSPPVSSGTSPVTDYVIQYNSSKDLRWRTVSDGINTRTSYTFLKLSRGTTFNFRVVARNASGSGLATTISATTSR